MGWPLVTGASLQSGMVPEERSKIMARDPSLDALHDALIQAIARSYEAQDARPHTDPFLPAIISVQERIGDAVAALDGFIPGGCPEGSPADTAF